MSTPLLSESEVFKQADLQPGITLQPHQTAVVDKVQKQLDTQNKARLLLYHSLGSGKTLSGLAAADATKIPYTAVVPAALRNNLRKEQERFIDPATATPSSVMSHTAVGNGTEIENPQSILVDEAHRFRNPKSSQTKNLMEAARKARQVVLLTGTPVVNDPSDFSVPYNILTGDSVTPEEFSKKYVDEVPNKPWYKALFDSSAEEPAIINQDELKSKLKNKVDYFAPLAPKAEINRKDVVVEMGRDQTDLNSYMMGQLPPVLRWKLKMNYPLTQDEITKMTSFMTGLRQVGLSTLPFMRGNKDVSKAFEQSPKLTAALGNLKSLFEKDPQGKALVFSNFIDAGLSPYQDALNKAGIPAASFTGNLSDKERKKLVDDYNTDKLKVALLGPSGTEGLSFKGTKLVQLLDPHWNTARSSQSEGRALRFDSHEHLAPEDRKVLIERYIARTAPGRLRSFLRNVGIKADPLPATDDYLINAADRKQKLNEQFLNILKEVGSNKMKSNNGIEKSSGLLDVIKPYLPSVTTAGRMALGATAGYNLEDAYQKKVYPDIPQHTLEKSKVNSALWGAVMATPRATTAVWNAPVRSLGSGLGGFGIIRHGIMAPEYKNGIFGSGIGPAYGEYVSKTQGDVSEFAARARDPRQKEQVDKWIQTPFKSLGDVYGNKSLVKMIDTANANASQYAAKAHKEYIVPAANHVIKSLGGDEVADPSLKDLGKALIPHVTGGLAGSYLGNRAMAGIANYIFPDEEGDEYDDRRRQEDRRWWLKLVGEIGGGAAGVAAAVHALRPSTAVKTAGFVDTAKSLLLGSTWYNGGKSLAKHIAFGTGLTGAQYLGGVVPKQQEFPVAGEEGFDTDSPSRGYNTGTQQTDWDRVLSQTAGNTLLSYTTGLPSIATKYKKYDALRKAQPIAVQKHMYGPSPLTDAAILGTGAVNMPGITSLAQDGVSSGIRWKYMPHTEAQLSVNANPVASFTEAFKAPFLNTDKKISVSGALVKRKPTLDELSQSHPESTAMGKDETEALRSAQPLITETKLDEKGRPILRTTTINDETKSLAHKILQQFRVPFATEEGNEDLKDALKYTGIKSIQHGAGLVGGGFAGMLGGDWLTDKILKSTVSKDSLKRNKDWYQLIRDLGSVAGMGLGAYGGLRGVDSFYKPSPANQAAPAPAKP